MFARVATLAALFVTATVAAEPQAFSIKGVELGSGSVRALSRVLPLVCKPDTTSAYWDQRCYLDRRIGGTFADIALFDAAAFGFRGKTSLVVLQFTAGTSWADVKDAMDAKYGAQAACESACVWLAGTQSATLNFMGQRLTLKFSTPPTDEQAARADRTRKARESRRDADM